MGNTKQHIWVETKDGFIVLLESTINNFIDLSFVVESPELLRTIDGLFNKVLCDFEQIQTSASPFDLSQMILVSVLPRNSWGPNRGRILCGTPTYGQSI
jgi:hypothetical protein